MSEVDPQEFGELKAEVRQLSTQLTVQSQLIADQSNQIAELVALMNKAKGGWKTVALIGSAFLGLASLISLLAAGVLWAANHLVIR